MIHPAGWGPSEKAALDKLCHLLRQGLGARIGETAVVSTKVHLTDPSAPWEIQVVATSDAGRAFYNRRNAGQIVHVDVFHSPGDVAPAAVAGKTMSALASVQLEGEGRQGVGPGSLVSFIDVQTAVGGGRLDGPLAGGRETGVRMAHKTHVHMTFLNCPELLASVFTMVAAVEEVIEVSGLELRKVRTVRMTRGGAPAGLDDYRATTDSFLREGRTVRHDRAGTGVGPSCISSPFAGDLSGEPRTQRDGPGPSCAGSRYGADSFPGTPPGEVSGDLVEALAREAVRVTGSYEDAVRLLRNLAAGMKGGELSRFRTRSAKDTEEVKDAFLRSRLMTGDGFRYHLSAEGETVLRYLLSHRYELEAYLRRLLRTLPSRRAVPGQRSGAPPKPASCRRAMAGPLERGSWYGDLAVVETAVARAARGSKRFFPDDLRFYLRREEKSRPVILLIDASASMAGKRLQSAKELARTLVLTGKDDIAVCVFQDADARVVSGFTRNPRQVEQALSSIEASGLTPLARGLEGAMALARTRAVKPLILLITDGIPTVPSVTLSPVDDAIEAARKIAQRGLKLGCVGLEPNRAFLKQMVEAAKGTLYIVDEMESSLLASIARKERGY